MSTPLYVRFALAFALGLPSCASAPPPPAQEVTVAKDPAAAKDAPVPRDIKAAALKCDLPAFRAYMTPETAISIAKDDEVMKANAQALDDLFAQAQKRFGDRVHRLPHGLKFDIDGTDPRWTSVFGPQWAASVKDSPGPFFFKMEAAMFWAEECDVLRGFEACLSDASFCAPSHVEGSVLQIRYEKDGWRLVREELAWRPAARARMVAFVQSSIAVSRDHLTNAPSTARADDVMVELAMKYMGELKRFAADMQRIVPAKGAKAQ